MMPAAGGGVRQRTCRMYWCYACGRALRIISYPAATDVFCPRCFGRFLHEIDPPPRPSPTPPPLPPPGFLAPQHHFAPHYDAHHRRWRWVVYDAPTVPGRAFRQPMPSPSPAPVARVQQPSTPPAIDPGDYFTGGDMNLNTLVEELTQNDRPGPAPAAASAIDALPTVRITAAHMAEDGSSQCPVCKEEFGLGDAARELPCKHAYHSGCIVPWLRLHNSCPVCRSQLPSAGAPSSSVAGGRASHAAAQRRGGGSNGGGREREPQGTMVRWGPLSWVWPPRGMEEPDDAWEYGRHRHGNLRGRPEAGDAGGNDLSALQSFVLVATCVFFFSFFA